MDTYKDILPIKEQPLELEDLRELLVNNNIYMGQFYKTQASSWEVIRMYIVTPYGPISISKSVCQIFGLTYNEYHKGIKLYIVPIIDNIEYLARLLSEKLYDNKIQLQVYKL